MNHIYKVIWNHAKHCYTVVSEIAKSHSQSNKRVRSMTAVVAAAMMLTGFGGMAIEAANPAPDDTNIKIGKGADFAIWNGQTGHDGITSGYIAIGENAYAWDGEYSFQDYLTRKWSARIGTKEYLLDFNQGAVGSATWGKYRVTDGTKLAGAIAIGKNTMARTGSVMIGDHTYVGKLGDIEVDPAKKMTLNDSVYSTTLGSSSYNSGSMSAVTGAFSIISNKGTSTSYGTQNFGATIYGSLNSIESSSASSHSAGMANSVLGFGNRTQNTNASLVWGTGNEVTNSIENVTFSTKWNKTSASDAQKEIIKAMQSSDQYAGGSVMAIGGGNKADWAIYSQLLGVQNTLTGTEKDVSKLTMINGYKNTVTNAQNTTIIGSNNTATNIQSTIVMGDHNTLEGRKNVISLGNKNTVMADDAVAIGNGTKVTAESGVAIGAGSVADRAAGIKGDFAPANIPKAEKSTWTSTAGAFSVGEEGKTTRQITNVAAGSKATDAVNVAQLNQVASQAAASKTTVSDGTNTTVTSSKVAEDGHTDYRVNLNKDLTGIESISNGSKGQSKIVLNEGYTGMVYGDTSVVLNDNGVYLNGKVNVDKAGQIHNVTAGTADEDAVNVSQLNKQAAASKTTVSDGTNTTVTSTVAKDGHTDYKVNLNKDLTGIESMTNGLSSIRMGNGGTVTINNRVTIDQSGKISGVAAGEVKEGSTDAVNGSQLKGVENKVDKNTEAIGNLDKRVTSVEEVAKKHTTVSTDDTNVQINEDTNKDGGKDYKVSLNKDLNLSSVTTGDTKMDTNGVTVKDVSLTKDGLSIGNKTYVSDKGLNANDQKVTNVAAGDLSDTSTDAVNGSQLFATNQQVAQNAESINKLSNRKFGADDNKTVTVKPGQTLNINGDKQNISTSVNGNNSIKVELKKDITVDSVTANSVKVGDTSISTNGLTIKDGPSITKTGIYGGNQKVTGVAAGDISADSKDAVNGGQLFATNQQVAQNAQSISKLGNRINKVGAGAAALAALHPLDFDPDDKWDFAAGYGNYNGENAAAIGAYYRPNEDTMFSVGGSFGNGENMVNAGVSLKLGQGNHVSTSKVAMAKEIKDLRKEMEGLKSALLDANAGKKLDTSKLQLFPDVPKNHWAYEYVSTLKGNGVLTGYPDGEFKGDRPMTRYEFATMLYKAMLEGATLSDKILKEFAPELERFTVDTVHQDKDGKPTVERVRTVKAAK